MRFLYFTLVFAASSALATMNQIEFNLGRGAPISSIQAGGSSDTAGSRGTNWSADLMHRVGPRSYLGIGGGQFRSNDNVSQTFVPNSNSTLSSRSSSVLLLTRVDIPARSKMIPYALAGIGWGRNTLTVTDRLGAGTIIDQSKDTLAFATGLGLDYPLTDRLLIGIEGRYQSALKKSFSLSPAGRALTGTDSIQSSLNVLMWGVKVGIQY